MAADGRRDREEAGGRARLAVPTTGMPSRQQAAAGCRFRRPSLPLGGEMAEHVAARRPSPRSAIRTPDQRLRVFVSSTLDELASERAAAREAIERLRLTPVMFELGARPHP